jgi:ankyrin repeat protein
MRIFHFQFNPIASGARYFLAALALVSISLWVNHPATVLLMLLAQPLYMAGVMAVMGYTSKVDFHALVVRRGIVFSLLFLIYAVIVMAVIVVPTTWVASAPSPGYALLLSAGFVVGIGLLWRTWPIFGLVFLCDEAYIAKANSYWISDACWYAAKMAWRLTRNREFFFGAGIWVAFVLLSVIATALFMTQAASQLSYEYHRVHIVLWGCVLCPINALLLIYQSRRLWVEKDHADDRLNNVDTSKNIDTTQKEINRWIGLSSAELDARLLTAAAESQVDLALSLLAAGASVHAKPKAQDVDQRTLAIIAATLSDLRLLRDLIKRHVDLNQSVNGLTPLIAATRDSYSGRPDTVMMLVTNGVHIGAVDAEGNTALHYASLSQDTAVVATLVDAGADLNLPNRDGMTPLGVACTSGNQLVVRYLLERGAKPEVARAMPALIAACTGSEDLPSLVKLLLKHKASSDVRDSLGRSALHAAALQGHAEMADVLIGSGVDVNLRDAQGVSALMEAARAGSNRVLQRLVFRKPQTEFTDRSGRTALIIACQSRQANEETIRLLLAMNANPKAASKDGKSALDFSVAAGRWNLVALIDSEYKLPSVLADIENEVDDQAGHHDEALPTDRCQLLAQSVRHGRFNVADELVNLEPKISQQELAHVFEHLAGHVSRDRLEWLLEHGLSANTDIDQGTSLLFSMIRRRPLSLLPIDVLMRAGAYVGGGELLVSLLAEDAAIGESEIHLLEHVAHELLERGANMFARDERERSLLHLAINRRAYEFLNALLERGLDPNLADSRGRTALHELSVLPDIEAVPMAKILLAYGANPERGSADGQTAVGAALASGRAGLIRWLSWSSGFKHPGRKLRHTDLPWAAQCGDVAAVDRLIVLGLPMNSQDAQGCTALLRACGGGYAAIVALLLRRGADVMITANNGATCLSAAISAGREAIVLLLLEQKIDPNQRLPGGSTALMIAAALGMVSSVRKLLQHGADAKATDEQGNGALHAAAQFAFSQGDSDHNRELLDALVKTECSINAVNGAGQSPLLLLLGAHIQPGVMRPRKGLIEAVQNLLAQGADISAQDHRGVSVLHAVAMHGLLDCCALLIRAGADLNARDRLNRTPYEIALMLGYADLAVQLKKTVTQVR